MESEGALKALAQGLPVRIPARTVSAWATNIQMANPSAWRWNGNDMAEEMAEIFEPQDNRGSFRAFDPENLDKVDDCRYDD